MTHTPNKLETLMFDIGAKAKKAARQLAISSTETKNQALQNAAKDLNFMQSSLYGFGAGAGFSLVLIFFSAMRERLAAADIPAPFEGAAIAMITAGLMSLAFMGFGGLV